MSGAERPVRSVVGCHWLCQCFRTPSAPRWVPPKSPQHWQSQCHPAWAAQGGQSHFRGEDAYGKGNAVRAAKIGTVPCERLRSTASAAYEPAVGGNPAANASTRAIISWPSIGLAK